MSDSLPPQRPQIQKHEASVWSALQLAWELGYLIALPAALFAFGGAYLDKHFHSSPLYLLIGIAIALCISGIGVYRKVRQVTSK